MKSSRYLISSVFILILCALLTGLTTTEANAAESDQTAEERIVATLEEAAASLGGFSWEQDTYTMMRASRLVGTYTNVDGQSISVMLSEWITIWAGEYDFCADAISKSWKPYVFHGMSGCIGQHEGGPVWSIAWSPSQGTEINGNVVTLMATSSTDYSCGDASAESADVCGNWGQESINALPLAEALHQAAINNGLYEPVPEEAVPVSPGETISENPEVPVDSEIPTDTSDEESVAFTIFGVPIPVLLASFGVPIAGAVTGAGISAILNSLSAAKMKISVEYQKTVFLKRFDDVIQQKIAEKYYIKNANFAKNPDSPEWFPIVKDGVTGGIAAVSGTEEKGGRCGEATEWGKQWLGQIAKDTFGQETFVGNIDVTREGYFENWDVNHRSVKLVLPNGERLVPDVHESLIAKKAVLYDEQDWLVKYVNLIGGKTTVERTDFENDVINKINLLGVEKGVAGIRMTDQYKVNPATGEVLINSYSKYPCQDPVAESKPVKKTERSLGPGHRY